MNDVDASHYSVYSCIMRSSTTGRKRAEKLSGLQTPLDSLLRRNSAGFQEPPRTTIRLLAVSRRNGDRVAANVVLRGIEPLFAQVASSSSALRGLVPPSPHAMLGRVATWRTLTGTRTSSYGKGRRK